MATPPAGPAVETPERLAFYERIGRKHMTPLWTSLSNGFILRLRGLA